MKKLLILVAAFLFLGIGAQAQTTMKKGDLVGSARLGYNTSGLPLAVSLDYGIMNGFINGNAAISVGGEVGSLLYTKTVVAEDGTTESNLALSLGLAVRGNFHYEFVPNLDTYAGLKAGVSFNAESLLNPGLHVGARYYLGKLAINLELDGSFSGGLIPGGSVGVSMKL